MQSGCLNTNITKATLPTPHIEGACAESVRCCSDIRRFCVLLTLR